MGDPSSTSSGAEVILITKSNGETAPYEQAKLRRSLQRSGAKAQLIEDIVAQIESEIQPGWSTRQIYQRAFGRLRQKSRPVAGKYKLKRAILELGPTGYPFEHFIAALLDHQGFDTRVGMVFPGRCVSHEVDVWAQRDREVRIAECKFHRDVARKNNVQVPLYFHARFNDLRDRWLSEQAGESHAKKDITGWIVTNTRFSSDAIQYGTCSGLHLVGWDQPAGGSIKDWIDESGFHPITCLTSLNKAEKRGILQQGVVLCQDLNTQVLEQGGIARNKWTRILQEAKGICSTQGSEDGN
jgi:hypothetical protein